MAIFSAFFLFFRSLFISRIRQQPSSWPTAGLRAIKIPKYQVKLFHHRDTVYPIPGYGAIEIGAHRFYEKKAGKDDVASGEAKFMHIWQNNDGAWKVTRMISYAYNALQK